MNKTVFIKRLVSGALVCSLVASFAACAKQEDEGAGNADDAGKTTQAVYTQTPGKVNKSETVYVTMDASGKPTQTLVSDWIHTDKNNVRVEDKSSLRDIENVKDDTAPVREGDKLVWNMSTTDLYYQGTTDKALPADISIQYELDGKVITPKELAGKSGYVKITVDVKNRTGETRLINGKEVTVYAPVALVGGTVFPENKFQNVTVQNGGVLGDGSKQIAAFIALPGLNEGLNLAASSVDEIRALEFPESFTITADVTDFSLGNMMFAMITSLPAFDALGAAQTVEDVKNSLYALRGMQDSVNQLDPNGVLRALFTDAGQMDSLTNLAAGLASLYDMNKALLSVVPKYMTADNMELLARIASHIQSSRLLNVIQDKNVKALLNSLGGIQEDQIMKLVTDLYTLSRIDFDKLDTILGMLAGAEDLSALLNNAQALADKIGADPQQTETFNALLGCTPEVLQMVAQFSKLRESMEQSGITLDESDIETMIRALVEKKMPAASAIVKEAAVMSMKNKVMPLFNTGNALSEKLAVIGMDRVESFVTFAVDILPDAQALMEQLGANQNALKSLTDILNDKELMAYLKTLSTTLSSLKQSLQSILGDGDLLIQALKVSQNPDVQQLAKFLPTLMQDISDTAPVFEAFSQDANKPAVKKSLENIPQTLAALLRLRTDLQANSSIVDALAGVMNPQTLGTAGSLIQQLDAMQAGTDLNMYAGIVETAEMLLLRAQAIGDVGQKYTIFTEKGDGMTSDLKFIMKTEEVNVQTEPQTEPSTEKGGIVGWIKGKSKS